MKNIEEMEVRGLSVKRLISYIIAIVSFIAALVYRDVKREAQAEELKMKVETLQQQLDAASKDRDAIKLMEANQRERIAKIEAKLESQK